MSKVCPQCGSGNPADASYCYFDGAALLGSGQGGPVQPGTLPFAFPFVFADGEACRNFNQFAMGCQRHWEAARDLLTQGALQNFLGSIGRADLASIARQCVATLDPDEALDQLMGKFPVDVLQPAKLAVEPTQVNLGQVRPANDVSFDLLLSNVGMRLLIGTVSSDCDWLVFGDGAGQKQSLFQTTHEARISVRVKGQRLRASAKPFHGRLFVESNGGTSSIKVQLSAPILAFPRGILQGAVTPRELALKAKQFPKNAAALFEQGAVSDWYKSNGWIYPVEGPSGSGLGAVQQFFEALGLTKPPRVAISEDKLAFQGTMGERIAGGLKVTTSDKRPVFAHAWCDQPWITFSDPQFQGAMVRLPYEVLIPPKPGEMLQGKITVRANGNQRFHVPITLSVDEAIASAEPVLTAELADEDNHAPPRDNERVNSSAKVAKRKRADKSRKRKAADGTFGMARLVYWSSLIGGWSAFVGWLVAEMCVGSSVAGSTGHLIAMIVIVASALGAGLSQTESLLTLQWKSQLKQLGPGLLGGCIGGLAGGLLGAILYEKLAFLGFLSRVLGWTVLGLFLGICQGILQGIAEGDWRKFRNGLIGGSLGGFLGGLFFDPVSWIIGSPVSSRAFAFVVLGLCIGLFLSLVQVLLKEAWLTVEEGFRPGRQLIMDQAVITMGTSEKANLIFIAYGAKGVEPVHLRIRRKKSGEYVLQDNDSRGGTLLNGEAIDRPRVLENGDVMQLGINKVRFHERVRRRNDVP